MAITSVKFIVCWLLKNNLAMLKYSLSYNYTILLYNVVTSKRMIIRSWQELRGSRFFRLSITLRLKYILPKLKKLSVYFRTVVQRISRISAQTTGRHIWTMTKRFVTCLGAIRLLSQTSIVPNPLNKYRSRGINVACRTRYTG